MSSVLNVLIVEDNPPDADLVLLALNRGGFTVHHRRVDTPQSMREALLSHEWDLITADYSMPHFSGLAAFEIYQEHGLDLPFIIVSGSVGEEVAVEAMKAGVHDYVMKGNLTRLSEAVKRELRDAAGRKARRAAEIRLRQVERLQTIGELTASLIHDLKNPLNAIQLSTDLLSSDDMEDSKRDKYCGVIKRQIKSIVEMANDVLDFARGNVHLSLLPLNPSHLAQELVELLQSAFLKSGVSLSFRVSPSNDSLVIVADALKITRALQNLINNAKEVMTDGGKITLQLDATASEVVFAVIDEGGGIPVEIRETLFEPFVTKGKSNGTGLGLAIVKSIVDAHGGSITFTVREEIGTTFWLRLPRHVHASHSESIPELVS